MKIKPRDLVHFVMVFLISVLVSSTAVALQSSLLLRGADASVALESDMPVVFVDALEAVVDVGETFTISVKVFNLSGNFYTTEELWEEGDPLPPLELAYWRYNYSLGYLYGLDLRLSWDPTILDYVSHMAMVPVDDYPGGILNGPDVLMVYNGVNETAGTYQLLVASQAPARGFDLPNDNATAFTMTFTAKATGTCDINFTNVDLAVDLVGLGMRGDVQPEIPHWTKNGSLEVVDTTPPSFESVDLEGTSPSPFSPAEFIRANEAVAVSANITDSGGLAGAVLSYRVDGGAWWNTTMAYNATSGLWITVIPGQLGGTTVELFITATDYNENVGTSSTLPYDVQALLVGDVDGDGDVDIFDIVKAAVNYGKTLP
jgi:hypothetical protein